MTYHIYMRCMRYNLTVLCTIICLFGGLFISLIISRIACGGWGRGKAYTLIN